jgi:hypothetical protein
MEVGRRHGHIEVDPPRRSVSSFYVEHRKLLVIRCLRASIGAELVERRTIPKKEISFGIERARDPSARDAPRKDFEKDRGGRAGNITVEGQYCGNIGKTDR